MASSLTSFLPPTDGLLPKWLFLTSVISIANSIQAYSTLHFTRRLYCPVAVPKSPPASTKVLESSSPVTPLSARTFGTWTFLSSLIRIYAAYNIDNEQFYQLAILTYGVAWAHFMSEWWVFGTTRWGTPLAGPVFVSTGSILWMWLQWSNYVPA